MNTSEHASEFKAAIYEQLARIGKAVASPTRLQLLDLLSQAPRTVETLAQEAGLSIANTSQHLRLLRMARLVDAAKEGLFVRYRLADPMVNDFLRSLRAIAEARIAEIDTIVRQFTSDIEALEPVQKNALLKKIKRGEVIVLDVRPSEEYEAGHIPGAISVPLKELKAHISRLPRDQEIVAYCRGPYCVLAIEAVKILTTKGFRAIRLEDGIPEWRAKGLPVVTGADAR